MLWKWREVIEVRLNLAFEKTKRTMPHTFDLTLENSLKQQRKTFFKGKQLECTCGCSEYISMIEYPFMIPIEQTRYNRYTLLHLSI